MNWADDVNQKRLWKAKLWGQHRLSKLSVKPSRNTAASSNTVLLEFFRQRRRGNISAPTRRSLACMVTTRPDRKSTRLNSSHQIISYAVFCLKKKNHVQHSQLLVPARALKHTSIHSTELS